MNLAFKLDSTVIFSADDPDYRVGKSVKEETFPLTPGEEKAKILFMRVVEAVKAKGLKTDIDTLIDSVQDYIRERRMREDEYGLNR